MGFDPPWIRERSTMERHVWGVHMEQDMIVFVVVVCYALVMGCALLASLMIEPEQDEQRPDVIVWGEIQ